MLTTIRAIITLLIIFNTFSGMAQGFVKGKIIDAVSKEPIHGASVHCTNEGCSCSCISTSTGEFELHCIDCKTIVVSFIGFNTQQILVSKENNLVELAPSNSLMNEVVVTATRGEITKRSQAPVAISTISNKMLQDARPVTIDQVLNKVSGVNMVNLGNEQHQMSIRQPMTTKSLFLYLEDGIPVRTTGLFNHNALLEMNMAGLKNIEVIKGPSSSLYGSEAIGGVVNFITIAPTTTPLLKISAQANNIGYKRTDLQSSFRERKWGFAVSGYYADKRNGFMEYSDFHKGIFTARVDYHFSDKTSLSNNFTKMSYYSDMSSGVDSTMFATKTFVNPQTFTYRKVDASRYRSTVTQAWNNSSKSSISLIYRDNTIGQNPNYRIKDDYRKSGNTWTGKKDLAHGEINVSNFNSYAVVAQHKQNLNWKQTSLTGGVSMDFSPSTYDADYIRIKKDTISKKYVSYQETDSLLTNYKTKISNYAAFASLEVSPIQKLRVVASLRYDHFNYDFDNHLKPSAFSGSPDTTTQFSRFSPKLGFTYNISSRTGFYGNYSQGFVPPQVTEMFTGVKVPNLDPSVFYNYEIGGWAELIKNKLSIDASAYKLIGTNEIISVKMDDGSSENRNAGRTSHKGIEFGLNATPVKDVTVRIGGAFSEHKFVQFVEKGNNYNGYEMNGAPNWMHNAEIWFKPCFAKGLRIGAEWQKIGTYYMDPKNTMKYDGYDVFNIRAGYQYKGFEVWVNVMNATGNYFSYNSSKTTSGQSYTLAEPRSFNTGISYNFGHLLKN